MSCGALECHPAIGRSPGGGVQECRHAVADSPRVPASNDCRWLLPVAVLVEHASDELIWAYARETPDDINNFSGRLPCGLAALPVRDSQLGVHAARPVDCEDNLARIVVKIDDDLMDDCTHDTFLEAHVCIWLVPDCCEVLGQV